MSSTEKLLKIEYASQTFLREMLFNLPNLTVPFLSIAAEEKESRLDDEAVLVITNPSGERVYRQMNQFLGSDRLIKRAAILMKDRAFAILGAYPHSITDEKIAAVNLGVTRVTRGLNIVVGQSGNIELLKWFNKARIKAWEEINSSTLTVDNIPPNSKNQNTTFQIQ